MAPARMVISLVHQSQLSIFLAGACRGLELNFTFLSTTSTMTKDPRAVWLKTFSHFVTKRDKNIEILSDQNQIYTEILLNKSTHAPKRPRVLQNVRALWNRNPSQRNPFSYIHTIVHISAYVSTWELVGAERFRENTNDFIWNALLIAAIEIASICIGTILLWILGYHRLKI